MNESKEDCQKYQSKGNGRCGMGMFSKGVNICF